MPLEEETSEESEDEVNFGLFIQPMFIDCRFV